MLIDLRPLRVYRDYRLLFFGQTVSYLGSMVSYVAVPYQVYELTHSTFHVGLLGAFQLAPVLVFGLVGGAVADASDRRRLMLGAEAIMGVCALGLALNAARGQPSVAAIYVLSALLQAANGMHRPAMDALSQVLVEPADLPAMSALGSLRYNFAAVTGPALGGALLALGGAKAAYAFDALTFALSFAALALLRPSPAPAGASPPGLASVAEGLRFALARPVLVGTYIVDFVAMLFAFPTALFPAFGERWGGAAATGALFSAMSAGSLLLTLVSGWTARVDRRGAGVVLSAGAWGAAVVAFGFAPGLPAALFFLAVAGAADMLSGLFRGVIWNETVPNAMRGRLAGIEMISYMTGPLLGNARAGWVASAFSLRASTVSGGALCVAGVALAALLLPAFWRYRSSEARPRADGGPPAPRADGDPPAARADDSPAAPR
ncbi:MAG TPA: MFS transporter [Polyangiaceae bacterium]|nr:MFS transporter [Polyangiaceae bacterium]